MTTAVIVNPCAFSIKVDSAIEAAKGNPRF